MLRPPGLQPLYSLLQHAGEPFAHHALACREAKRLATAAKLVAASCLYEVAVVRLVRQRLLQQLCHCPSSRAIAVFCQFGRRVRRWMRHDFLDRSRGLRGSANVTSPCSVPAAGSIGSCRAYSCSSVWLPSILNSQERLLYRWEVSFPQKKKN